MPSPLQIPFLFAALLLSSIASVDPSGHWEGTIRAPEMEVSIEADLFRNANRELAGTFANLTRNVKAIPLSNVAVEGSTVTFEIKANGGGTFRGALGADGKTMTGTFTTSGPSSETFELPFSLTRTGEARIEAPAKSAPISKDLEGTWSGTLEVEGKPRQVGLKLSNHADGTSTGAVISGEGMQIPITTILQEGASVTLDVKNIGGSYAGTLKAEGKELVGTWTQGPFVGPLTFRRAP